MKLQLEIIDSMNNYEQLAPTPIAGQIMSMRLPTERGKNSRFEKYPDWVEPWSEDSTDKDLNRLVSGPYRLNSTRFQECDFIVAHANGKVVDVRRPVGLVMVEGELAIVSLKVDSPLVGLPWEHESRNPISFMELTENQFLKMTGGKM